MSEMLQDIQIDLFLHEIKAASQKQVLQALAKYAAGAASVWEQELLEKLEEKDVTSTFAIGDGIALPNLQLRFIPRPFKALCTLKKPVDFDAPDGKDVEIVCLVLSPQHEGPLHLRRLARMSRLLNNAKLRRDLRAASNVNEMRSLISAPQSVMLAA